VRHVHRALRKALNDAVAVDRLIPSNPCTLAKLPRAGASSIELLWKPEHLRIFLAFARSHRLYAFFHLAAYTGARRGELIALRWSMIDFEAGAVTLRASTDVVAGERIEDTPKGGRTRTIEIDPGTVAVLRRHRVRQLEERARLGAAWLDPGDFVFRRESGAELYPDTVTNLMTKLIRAHNEPVEQGRRGRPRRELPRPAVPLPPARLHDLRHLHATTLLLAGEALHVVSHRLGHADPAITLRVYAHVLRQHNAALAQRFASEVGLVLDGVSS
jgi:integrase